MSKACAGARVLYCGHNGWFIADIYRVADANVIVANGPVRPENIERPGDEATHHLIDFPVAGYWKPDRGVFVVPGDQVVELPKEGEVQRG